jgi:hypothetical protein
MFKDLPEGTTNCACPKCGGICNGQTEHVCKAPQKRSYIKRSPYWRVTLKQRIKAAIKAFKAGR